MSRNHSSAHFGANGRMTALIADAIDYPEDGVLTGLTDEQIGEFHESFLTEANELANADPTTIDPVRTGELVDRIGALRTEAATRMAAAEAAAEGQPTEAERQQAADDLAALLNPPAGDAGGGEGDGGTGDGNTEVPGAELHTIDPAVQARATAEAVTAAVTPIAQAFTDGITALAERIPAQPTRSVTAAGIGRHRPDDLAPTDDNGQRTPVAPRGSLIASHDIPGIAAGQPIETMDQLVQAFAARQRTIGATSSGVENEQVIVASYQNTELPSTRDLRGLDPTEARRRALDVIGPEAIGIDPWTGAERPIGRGGIAVADPESLVASGGLAAPVEPYYPQLVLAVADRPVLGSMPTFVADRGGIRGVLPPTLGALAAAVPPGQFNDGTGAGGTTALTSATAAFVSSDVGQQIIETDAAGKIPAGTFIASVTNGTTIVLSQATTAGAFTTVQFRLPARNPNNLGNAVGLVTAAQDASGPPGTVKFTYDAANGTQYEHDVYSVYTSLQFANLTSRTFPEQVDAYIRVANALAARVADTAALDYISKWSTLFTGAKTFGTARQLLAQWEHEAAYYRNHNRMDPAAVVRLGIPAWALNAMRADFISGFIGSGFQDSGLGLSDDELNSWFADRHILPWFYLDGPSDISQLFPTPASTSIGVGTGLAPTPIAIPDYPGAGATTSFRTEVVSFMWAEGTWLGLTTGELNVGLVRDSTLNSQNRFRNFEEVWETPAFVGTESLRCVHTVASDGSYGAAVTVVLGAGNGL